ncbi:MAG: hypothetical protein ABIX28_09850 [Vicinamibacterales bacterium]
MFPRRLGPIVLAARLAGPNAALAQTLPAGPVRAMDGQILVNGEAVATIAAADDVAYFNYTDYEHNALRLFRLAVTGSWQPARRLAFVGELRSEDLDRPRAYAAYVRVRPWVERQFDLQIGRIPPSFGVFSRRAYSTDNPVIGYPLAYQYLTSIRPDAVPATADDLTRMRARGWLSSFPVGNADPSPGVPLVTAFRWDTGVQAHWRTGIVDAAGAVTSGTLSDPHAADNNRSPQVSGRVALEPAVGLIVGASAARGAWLSKQVARILPGEPDASDYTQQALGADAEYSRDHWLVRSELIWSRWRLPFATTAPDGVDLDALAVWVEGRYKLTPRVTLGLRADHLGFSDVTTSVTTLPWDGPINRVEAAIGYAIQRNLTARVGVQKNDRKAGRVRSRTYLSAQLAYWF